MGVFTLPNAVPFVYSPLVEGMREDKPGKEDITDFLLGSGWV